MSPLAPGSPAWPLPRSPPAGFAHRLLNPCGSPAYFFDQLIAQLGPSFPGSLRRLLKTSGFRKSHEKLISTTPPFFPSAAIISSSYARRGRIWRGRECDAKIGACSPPAHPQTFVATCEMSTIIPIGSSRPTISRPGAKARCSGVRIADESASDCYCYA